MKALLKTLALMMITYVLSAQQYHLEIEGHSKIRGNLDISNMVDTTSIFIGPNAGESNITSFLRQNSNTFVGYSAGQNNTYGVANSFFGAFAGRGNTIGGSNSFFGCGAGSNNTGNSNTFFGSHAGRKNSAGFGNTCIGNHADLGTDSLNKAIAIGYNAGVNCSNCAVIGGLGIDAVNVGIGTSMPRHQLDLGSTAGKKLAVFQSPNGGDFYGFGISSDQLEFYAGVPDNAPPQIILRKGTGNLGIGASQPLTGLHVMTGEDVSLTGHGNILMGAVSGDNIAMDGNEIQARSNNSASDLFLQFSGGNVAIGPLSPNVALDVEGNIEYTGSIMGVSDIRLKENIEDLDNALAAILQLRGFTYNIVGKSQRSAGVSAQDVLKVLPEAVSKVDNVYLGVDYTQLVPLLIEGMKEQQQLIDQLNKEIEQLRKSLNEIESLDEADLPQRS